MARRRPFLVSDGIFYGAMSFILAATFALGIAFAHVEIAGNSLVGGVMLFLIVAGIAGWIIARWAAGGDLPPPNSVRITPRKAPTVPRSPAAEKRAAAQAPHIPTSAHEAGVAVGAAMKSVADAVRDVTAQARETAAETIRPDRAAEAPRAQAETTAAPAEPAEERGAAMETATATPTDEGTETRHEGAVARGEGAAGRQPPTLPAPRGGAGDDLLAIRGIGPKLGATLNEAGYYHYDQIAAWTEEEVRWIDENIDGVNGRASRDDWVGQARDLLRQADTGQH
jgi:predicted flap endonuclease-1-like 5' DNA nuclease